MRRMTIACLVFGVAVISLQASDRIGIYAVIDRVVLQPSADKPERVQLWGSFAVATRGDANLYDPVQRGYLYFSPGDERALALREWNDLKAMADGKHVVGFSSRFGQSVRVRTEKETPQAPDKYVTGIGIQTIRPDRDYAPIKALSPFVQR